MPENSDWLPRTYEEILKMCHKWIEIINLKMNEWNMRKEVPEKLQALHDKALASFIILTDKANKSPNKVQDCADDFAPLKEYLRDVKRDTFHKPTIKDVDFIDLQLKIPDDHPAPVPAPVREVAADPVLASFHQMGWKVRYIDKTAKRDGDKGYKVFYHLAERTDPAPTKVEDFSKSFYTTKNHGLLEFLDEDTAKKIYFLSRVENDGKEGPLGPITSAGIP
jgi:hypothetical protein